MKQSLIVMVVLMIASTTAAAQEDTVFQDDLLDNLVGTWIVKTAHDRPTRIWRRNGC